MRPTVCLALVLFLPALTILTAQTSAPATGDVTVRLMQPLDSANARPNQTVPGTVQKSTNPDIPIGTSSAVLLVTEPSGVFSVHLVRLGLAGQLVRTASSPGVLAGVSKLGGFIHDQGVPKTASSGPRVYLPANTDIRFTLTDAPPQGPASPARVGRKAPLPPPHPANTVVDLPPAAPGYPPIHASNPAQENCWWISYVSDKFGLEAAVQTCADKSSMSIISETEHGIAWQYLGNTPLNPPTEFVKVMTKPADQSIEDAIKQQLIMKLKSPAARLSCKVMKGFSNSTPAETAVSPLNKDVQYYSVAATGAYAKQKRFQGEEAEEACSGLEGNDAIAVSFQYNPAESKTKFLFYQEDDNGSVFNGASVHFKPEQ